MSNYLQNCYKTNSYIKYLKEEGYNVFYTFSKDSLEPFLFIKIYKEDIELASKMIYLEYYKNIDDYLYKEIKELYEKNIKTEKCNLEKYIKDLIKDDYKIIFEKDITKNSINIILNKKSITAKKTVLIESKNTDIILYSVLKDLKNKLP